MTRGKITVSTPAVANHNLGVGQRDGEAVANHDFGVVHHDGEGAVVTPVWQSTTLVSGTTTTRAPSLPLDVPQKTKKVYKLKKKGGSVL